MFNNKIVVMFFLIMGFAAIQSCESQEKTKLKALIIDGENSHGVWPKTTIMMKSYLEETGLFDVDIERTTYTWQGPHHNVELENVTQLIDSFPIQSDKKHIVVDKPTPDPNYSPNFEVYDVVISNFGWKASDWNETTKSNFETYIKNGGGLVVVHAADNPWSNWDAFNKMIAIGGWDGRTEKNGPYLYYDTNNKVQRDTTKGNGGAHGPKREFAITTREPQHPIMKGLPTTWMHAKDELYERLRGPAENVTILATGFSNDRDKATFRHEPLLMTIDYGKGRIFHSTLGHMDFSMECVGFITTLQRGAEWAATGNVTQKIPEDFPDENSVSIRFFRN